MGCASLKINITTPALTPLYLSYNKQFKSLAKIKIFEFTSSLNLAASILQVSILTVVIVRGLNWPDGGSTVCSRVSMLAPTVLTCRYDNMNGQHHFHTFVLTHCEYSSNYSLHTLNLSVM